MMIDRRGLLKNALGGGAALALAGANAQGSSLTEEPTYWHMEYDVVVVGSGTGLVASIVTARAGLKVLVLEKAGNPGGNVIVSGGVLWIPNNNIMSREGISDSREDAITYLNKLSLGQADDELIASFLDNGPRMADFLEANTGLKLRVSKLMGEAADYHPEWPGSIHKGRSLEPVQPGIALAGGLLATELHTAAIAAGVDILYSTPARQLITTNTDTSGQAVIGVEASGEQGALRIRAKAGVLIASGGFERNEEMKRHFLRGPSMYSLSIATNTGDGIHMGMAIGADLRNMNEVWGLTVFKGEGEQNSASGGAISLAAQIDRRNAGCIAVNRYGQRFCNEAADYDSTWRSYHAWENWGDLGYRNLPAFQLYDQKYRDKFTLAGRQPTEALPDWVAVADTMEQLARKLSIDPQGLASQIERFNRYARLGQDPDFHRGESAYDTYARSDAGVTLAPLDQGPYYGAEVAPADLGTCGGLRVNGLAQVIDVFDRPIKNLYASGNAAGVGSPGALYGGGGGTLGPALTFAFIAGEQLCMANAQ
jgi:3-oxosteroid 1-dehydrogenase